MKLETGTLENRLARAEARMRALQEGIEELKRRMGETVQ